MPCFKNIFAVKFRHLNLFAVYFQLLFLSSFICFFLLSYKVFISIFHLCFVKRYVLNIFDVNCRVLNVLLSNSHLQLLFLSSFIFFFCQLKLVFDFSISVLSNSEFIIFMLSNAEFKIFLLPNSYFNYFSYLVSFVFLQIIKFLLPYLNFFFLKCPVFKFLLSNARFLWFLLSNPYF